MPRLHRIDAPGYPRHIGLRGIDGMDCFRDDKDRHVFLTYLREALAENDCALCAFVLMTNHVHLLATPRREGAVPAMMQSLGTRYVRYFNATHERTGPLFGGRYWASLIETERYLLAAMRYIELNPVRARLVDRPGRYPWSSHRHNTGRERRVEVTFHEEYLRLGRTPADCAVAWEALVEEGIAPGELTQLRRQLRRNRPLGCAAFLERFATHRHPPEK
jgi:putative transposase